MDKHERAIKAAQERWNPTIPKATHSGILLIAGQEIACDVLEDGKRMLRKKTFLKAMGKSEPNPISRQKAIEQNLPLFICANNLTPYLGQGLKGVAEEIIYKLPSGQKVKGYQALLLPEVCKVYVRADDENILKKRQIQIAKVCRSILYSLANVGVIALVDECTNFQEIRARDELQILLKKYISEELLPWTKKFPNEFFKQIYRLHGWEYPKKTNHPQYVGKIINKYVYEKLPEGVLEELKKKNPADQNGIRSHRHHQFLTEDIGNDTLQKQILQTITVMKLSDDIDGFKKLIEKL